jgi:hypothetical protein
MSDALTPWEEINPPMVSAPQRGLPSKCSDRLTPASNVEFRNELTACLALTAPAGMTEEGRGEWLAVAWETLKHLPPDLLAMGCRKARETCDHPSKIVPAIVEATKDSMRFRHEYDRPVTRALPEPKPKYCSPEEAAEILRSVGIKPRYSPGSKPNGRDHEDGLDAQHESRT